MTMNDLNDFLVSIAIQTIIGVLTTFTTDKKKAKKFKVALIKLRDAINAAYGLSAK
jgi:hypothetical protein